MNSLTETSVGVYDGLCETFLTIYGFDEETLDRMTQKMYSPRTGKISPGEGGIISLLQVFLHIRKYGCETTRDAYIKQFLAKPMSYRSTDELTNAFLSKRQRAKGTL